MRAHVIENGVVSNTIEVGSLDILPNLIDASLGGKIGDLWNGQAFSAPPLAPVDLDALKAKAIWQVDADVDAVYVATVGNRQMEYVLAESEANIYKSAGYTGTVPLTVQSWATAKQQPAKWAADDILATAAVWRNVQASLRTNRLQYKEDMRNVPDAAALDVKIAAWKAYLTALQSQLVV